MTKTGKRPRFVSFHFDRLVSCLALSLQHQDLDSAKIIFVQLLPVLIRVPELMISAGEMIFGADEAFQLAYLRFLQLCFSKLPHHRSRVMQNIVVYYLRHGRVQEAFDYLDGHITSSPFNEDQSLLALHFQSSLQLCHNEKRPAVRERAFKKVGASFQAYMAAGGNDPQVCWLFYELVRGVGTEPDELRSVLETLAQICPTSVKILEELLRLLLSEFVKDRIAVIEAGTHFLQYCRAVGIDIEKDLSEQLLNYHTQYVVLEWTALFD